MANISKFAFDEELVNQDKAEWLEAKTITAEKSPDQIRAWLLHLDEGRYKTSMRNKLNHYKIKVRR